MSDSADECLNCLRALERDQGVIEAFRCVGSSSWVAVKNGLYERSLMYLGATGVSRRKALSLRGLYVAALSAWSYAVSACRRTARPLFVSAGSGLFRSEGIVRDSYVPSELLDESSRLTTNASYLISATHADQMYGQKLYIAERRGIVFSYLVSPVRGVLSYIGIPLLMTNGRLLKTCRVVCEHLSECGVVVRPWEVLRLHARFLFGVILYKLFLLPLRITKGFVVSAYSNSEICAVLRGRGLQVIEMQHGVVGKMHRGYNYAAKSKLLPTADIVRVYDNFWRRELLEAGYYESQQIEVAPRLKYVLAESETRAFAFDYVVFTGQGIYGEQVIEFLRKFDSLASRLRVIYIPHPNESRDYTGRIAAGVASASKAIVLNDQACSTERLILDSVAHVSIFSSCHFDSVHFKGKTYVLDVMPLNPLSIYMVREASGFVSIRDASDLAKELGGL